MNVNITRKIAAALAVSAGLAIVPAGAAAALTAPPSTSTYDSSTYNGGSADTYNSGSTGPSSERPKTLHPRPGSSYTDLDCQDTYRAFMQAWDEYEKAKARGDKVQEAYWYDVMQRRGKEFGDNCQFQ